ncbi:MAG: TolB family protein, partial [Planctomycetota bacterium]
MTRHPIALTLLLTATLLTVPLHAAEDHDFKFDPVGVVGPGGLINATAKYDTPDAQQDYPVLALAGDGQPLLAHLEYDGDLETLHLTRLVDGKLEYRGDLCRPGILHQPGLATDGAGATWCVWSQLSGDRWNLYARAIRDHQPVGPVVMLTQSAASDVFPDVKTDRRGRVWITWQAFDGGHAEIYAKHYDPKAKKWSDDFRVTHNPAGDWEPRLAFGADDEALIVFDSYRDGDYNLFLARVSPQGKSKVSSLIATPRYEARAEAAASPDGKTLYIAYEDGTERWGKDLGVEWRKIGGGLHYDRRVKFASLNLATGKLNRIADVTPLIAKTLATPGSVGSSAVDVPEITVDAQGRPWLFYRYCLQGKNEFWQIAATRYNPADNTWTKAQTLANSPYCQDRRITTALLPTGQILAAWPSDSRTSKQHLDSAIYLTSISPNQAAPVHGPLPFVHEVPAKAQPIIVNNTPERDRAEHHTWEFNGKKYTLYFGDVHRHTDFSSC